MKKSMNFAIRKSIAAVTAVALMSVNAVSMSVGAGNSHYLDYLTIFSLHEGEYGEAIVSTTMACMYSFIAVTDSTIQSSAASSDHSIKDIQRIPVDQAEFLATWDEASAQKLADYSFDAYYYQVNTISTGNNREDLPKIARRFMLDHEEVKDVYLYQCFMTGEGSWNGTLTMWIDDACTPEQHEQFRKTYEAEDEATFHEIKQNYLEQQEQVSQWMEKINADNMTKEEVSLYRKAKGLPTDYEMMKPIFDFADYIGQKYDEVEIAQPEIDLKGNGSVVFSTVTAYGNAVSAWENVGDLDSDGTSNAKDATSILRTSAAIGTGRETGLSAETLQYADVNADGNVNASDATLILRFSAKKGCGYDGALAEFVKES